MCFLLSFEALYSQSFPVAEIQIEGNKVTKAAIILRELDFKRGDFLDSLSLNQRLEKNRNQVFNTSLFNDVTISAWVMNDSIQVTIKVWEKWYIWPYPVLQFADRNFNIWWETKDFNRLYAGVRVHDYNFRGRGEKLKIHALFGYTNYFAVNYLVPYLDRKKRHGMHVHVGNIGNREAWYKTENNRLQFLYDPNQRAYKRFEASASYIFRPAIFSRHIMGLGFESVRVSDSILSPNNNPDFLVGGRSTMQSLIGFYTYIWDRRDIAYYPLKGHFIEANVLPRIMLEERKAYVSLHLNMEKFWSLGKEFYGALGLRAKASFADFQPYSLFQSMGYKYFVRGFEPYVVDGNHFVLLTGNLKYRIFSRNIHIPYVTMGQFNKAPTSLFVGIHTDGGYVHSNQFLGFGNDYSNRWLQGYGIGLDMATYYDRVIRLEYSINSMGLKGIYLHFTAPI